MGDIRYLSALEESPHSQVGHDKAGGGGSAEKLTWDGASTHGGGLGEGKCSHA